MSHVCSGWKTYLFGELNTLLIFPQGPKTAYKNTSKIFDGKQFKERKWKTQGCIMSGFESSCVCVWGGGGTSYNGHGLQTKGQSLFDAYPSAQAKKCWLSFIIADRRWNGKKTALEKGLPSWCAPTKAGREGDRGSLPAWPSDLIFIWFISSAFPHSLGLGQTRHSLPTRGRDLVGWV